MSSDTQGAEKRSFTVVNMPCFVQSKEAATSMLGGTGVLSDAINNKHSLVSNLATECPVNGQRRNFAGVVMRIKRKKKTKEVTSSDILGNVTSAYDFCQQADMKMIKLSAESSLSNSLQVMEAVPSHFFGVKSTHIDPVFSYHIPASLNNAITSTTNGDLDISITNSTTNGEGDIETNASKQSFHRRKHPFSNKTRIIPTSKGIVIPSRCSAGDMGLRLIEASSQLAVKPLLLDSAISYVDTALIAASHLEPVSLDQPSVFNDANPQKQVFLLALTLLFLQRPCWSRSMLETIPWRRVDDEAHVAEALKTSPLTAAQRGAMRVKSMALSGVSNTLVAVLPLIGHCILPLVARGVWCRYGYDPRVINKQQYDIRHLDWNQSNNSVAEDPMTVSSTVDAGGGGFSFVAIGRCFQSISFVVQKSVLQDYQQRIINCHKKLPGYKGVNDIVVDLDAYDDIAPVSCDDTYPAARSDVQLPADSVTKDIEEKIPSSSDVRAVDSDGPAVTIVLFRTKIRHTSSVQVCDISDVSMLEYITETLMPHSDFSCTSGLSSHFGWYCRSSLANIKDMLLKILDDRVDRYCNDNFRREAKCNIHSFSYYRMYMQKASVLSWTGKEDVRENEDENLSALGDSPSDDLLEGSMEVNLHDTDEAAHTELRRKDKLKAVLMPQDDAAQN